MMTADYDSWKCAARRRASKGLSLKSITRRSARCIPGKAQAPLRTTRIAAIGGQGFRFWGHTRVYNTYACVRGAAANNYCDGLFPKTFYSEIKTGCGYVDVELSACRIALVFGFNLPRISWIIRRSLCCNYYHLLMLRFRNLLGNRSAACSLIE